MNKFAGIKIGDKVIVTTDNWFYGHDGQTYRAAFGTVRGIFNDEAALGIKTNSKSTNWYAQVGNLLVAGCQVHYAIKTDHCTFEAQVYVNTHELKSEVAHPGVCNIYNADRELKDES